MDIDLTKQWMHELHAHQQDKAGNAYIGHLLRVHSNLCRLFPEATEDEKHAALLHDAMEDVGVTESELRERDYSEDTIAMVKAVTRTKDEELTYQQWIGRLAASGILGAIRIKIADLTDNHDPERLAALPGKQALSLSRRYQKALKTLWEVLESGQV